MERPENNPYFRILEVIMNQMAQKTTETLFEQCAPAPAPQKVKTVITVLSLTEELVLRLLIKGYPDTADILAFHEERHRQMIIRLEAAIDAKEIIPNSI